METNNTLTGIELVKELNSKRTKELEEHKIEAIKEVREYSEKRIHYLTEEIPHKHLFAIRGEYCDFYESQNFVNVYLKYLPKQEAFDKIAIENFSSVVDALNNIVNDLQKHYKSQNLLSSTHDKINNAKQALNNIKL